MFTLSICGKAFSILKKLLKLFRSIRRKILYSCQGLFNADNHASVNAIVDAVHITAFNGRRDMLINNRGNMSLVEQFYDFRDLIEAGFADGMVRGVVHHGAAPPTGKELSKKRVRTKTAHDVYPRDSMRARTNCLLKLCPDSECYGVRSLAEQPIRVFEGKLIDEGFAIVNTISGRDVDEFVRSKRDGAVRGKLIGYS